MLGIDTLVPEIMLGVGLAVFVGSSLAWVRAATGKPRPALMRSPSARQRIGVGERDSAGPSKTHPRGNLNRRRTAFFLVVGLVTSVWALVTLVARPS